MLLTSPTFWLILVMWATAVAFFLSKLDQRKLAVLVILLSLLLVAFLVRERGRALTTRFSVLLVSSSHVAAPG